MDDRNDGQVRAVVFDWAGTLIDFGCFAPVHAFRQAFAAHATLVPGALETIDWLRARGVRIGTTTGYTRTIMQAVLPEVKRQGFVPDAVVCSDNVAEGRPSPEGMRRCLLQLGLDNMLGVYKVDDTEPGIGEGCQAGCITVGLRLTGSLAGLTPAMLSTLDIRQREALRSKVGLILHEAGSDHLIDSVAELPDLLNRLPA